MKKKIVVSNVYGKFNLGDQAIRNSGLKLLSEIFKGGQFHLLCESIKDFPIRIPKGISTHVQYAPYGYAMDTEGKAHSLPKKMILLITVLCGSLLFLLLSKISSDLLPKKGFFSYINYIRTADVVFLMGGGYLVTKHHIADFFGIILNSVPLYIAKFFNKKIIILPISFGPFANSFHEFIIGKAIKNTMLYCRDKISLSFARKHNPEAKYMPDLALYEWREYEK